MTGPALYLGTALIVAMASCPRGEEATRLAKPAYEQRVHALYAEIQTTFRATLNVSGPALTERVARAQRALRRAANELSSARPPVEIEEENRELVEGFREYANALDGALRAASAGDVGGLGAFQDTSRHAAVRRIAEAAEEMKHKGYDLGPLKGDR